MAGNLIYKVNNSILIAVFGYEHRCVGRYSTSRDPLNFRSKKPTLKAYFKSSKKQKICVLCGALFGSICFVSYQVFTLNEKLKMTGNVHGIEREDVFLYPKQPLDLGYEDMFSNGIRTRIDYIIEKTKRNLIPWAQSKTKDPAILLELAESKDSETRRKGLKALTSDNDWEDYQYRMVAQSCTNQTMVSLARIQHSDYRLFRPMPWLPPPKESIANALQSLLAALQKEGIDDDIKLFTSKVLLEGKAKNIVETGQWNFGGTPLQYVKSLSDEADRRTIIFCLEALVNHTFGAEQCMKILELGGLQILQRVYLNFHQSIVVCRLIAWILANISLNVNQHKAVIDGGWIAVLHDWLNSSDTALFFHSARALANLDRDWESEKTIEAFYEDGVYLAYPVHKNLEEREKVEIDIVFIHGLMGGPFKTWRQKDRQVTEKDRQVTDKDRQVMEKDRQVTEKDRQVTEKDQQVTEKDRQVTEKDLVVTDEVNQENRTFFWPKDWLTRDVHNLRILNVGYQTELTTWDTRHPLQAEKRKLTSRSSDLLDKLERADIGGRPTIWVGHSMGGLIIKEILRIASTDSRFSKVLDNTIGVLFYSVPHHGSSLAKTSNRAKYMVFPSIEVQELDKDNKDLKELHRSFLRLQDNHDIPVLSFGETERTNVKLNMKLHFVPPEASDPGCGEYHVMKTNHINICKPRDTESDLYKFTLSFIRKCIFSHTGR